MNAMGIVQIKQVRIAILATVLVLFQVTPLSFADKNSFVGVLDTRVSFEVTNAEIGGVLKTLAQAFDLNIVVGEGVAGEVSLSLNNVRLEDALDLLLETTGYYYTVRDNIILIQSPEKEVQTEIILLNYVKAADIKPSIEALLSEQGEIVDSGDDHRIIVKEVPKRLKVVMKQIEELDHPPRQVIIEARMIEVEDSDLTAFGITWNNEANLAGGTDGKPSLAQRKFNIPEPRASTVTSPVTATTNSSNFGLSLQETSADLSGGQLNYGLTWGRHELATTIDALVRTNRAHILASPTIATMDGEEAKIIIGEKFPFRENTLTAVGTTETTKFVDIGTALRVVPKVLHGDDIMLELHPEVSSLNESLTAGPRINTREATTKVIVKNGQSIVIAGLIQNEKTVIRQKVPVLGNIPIIGLAFRNKSTDFVRKELAVFITPYLMNPMQSEEDVASVDKISAELFFNRAERLLDEFGIESLGKTKALRLSEAIANFKTVVRNYPESEVADDALFELGRIYAEEANNPEKAAEMWGDLIKNYKNSPYATNVLYAKVKELRRNAQAVSKKQKKRFK